MTRYLSSTSTILSAGFLFGGFTVNNHGWLGAGILAFDALWLVGLFFWWRWLVPVGLFVTLGMAAGGLLMNLQLGYFLPGALFGFLAWDLAEYSLHLHFSAEEDNTSRLEKKHLFRVGLLTLMSIFLCSLVLTLQLKFSFEVIVILLFFALWGIGRIVNWLMNREE